MRYYSPIVLLFLVVITSTGGLRASQEPAAGLEARESDFDRIQAMLDGPDPSERLDAAVALINLASSYNPLPHRVLDRLDELAYDSDPRVARRVFAALARMRENDEKAFRDAIPAGSEARAASREAELAEISEGLLSERWTERAGSIVALSNHIFTTREASPEVAAMLLHARDDSNIRVARMAESVLARIEQRPIEPAWGRSMNPKRAVGEDGLEVLPELVLGLESSNASNRLAALDRLLDAARTLGATEEAKIVTAFAEALNDPHPAVRSAAWFALNGGLAGREHALRRVHLGPTPIGTGIGNDERKAVANPVKARGKPLGFVDAYGAYYSALAPTRGPSPDEPTTENNLLGAEHAGAYDEVGVFVGIRSFPGGRSDEELEN